MLGWVSGQGGIFMEKFFYGIFLSKNFFNGFWEQYYQSIEIFIIIVKLFGFFFKFIYIEFKSYWQKKIIFILNIVNYKIFIVDYIQCSNNLFIKLSLENFSEFG